MSRTTKARRNNKGAASQPGASTETRSENGSNSTASPLTVAGICVGLVALVWAVFGQTTQFNFVNYDDNKYVFQNAHVRAGISLSNIIWAFTHLDIHLWSPVTALSHMLDCQLYQLAPGGHHLTNVLLHAATAVFLFLLFWEMTHALWRSAFVAACLAVRPLRVESVVWIAERKDVLDGFFFALTLLAYLRYARGNASSARLFLVALFLALGLMAKPMLITVPFLLLLLDYWPLARIREFPVSSPAGAKPARIEGLLQLIIEKIPLLLLAIAAVCVTTFASVSNVANKIAQPAETPPPLLTRLGNGVAASLIYIRQMFWPADTGLIQSTMHPILSTPMLALAVLFIAGLSGLAVIVAKKSPYVPVGWFWYFGMLVPVSGFGALGFESRADRYTYLPQIGLYLLITWAVADATARLPQRKAVLGVAMASILAMLGWIAFAHAQYWKDTMTLWTETLNRTSGNFIAEENFGADLVETGKYQEGIDHYRKAALIWPTSAALLESLGAALYQNRQLDDAIAEYQKAIALEPTSPTAHDNMGLALLGKGDQADAIAEYKRAEELNANDPYAHEYLGNVYGAGGRRADAIAEYQKAISLIPEDPQPRNSLAILLIQEGRLPEGIEQLQTVLKINPEDANAANNLAMLLAAAPDASVRDGARAVELAERAAQLTGGGDALILSTMAAAYAECGRFPDAVQTAERALQSPEAQSNPQLAEMLRSHIALYRAKKPLRDNSLAPHPAPAP
jgi:protein O-mannosyl-transferase